MAGSEGESKRKKLETSKMAPKLIRTASCKYLKARRELGKMAATEERLPRQSSTEGRGRFKIYSQGSSCAGRSDEIELAADRTIEGS